ncbi:cyclohexadienyl dehydratase [Fusobacterium mortiferum]|uniref:Cyclohexadienyl dehydratase n=1 Tax=Fusobacterium mortiferum TaxID=850 RepID=A0A414Q0U1_FUSMR|nr:transporter substrate-binding domain-containing protein [Fusobacterium mortiferum]MCI6382631.1 transporter substrate-binding domain-containing protein [Fusobacterium mortiferum]RHF64376.1 cyclohexadienyl dehydratase [Fusobacterium mortiferum]RHF74420.1 cyclohexadienyl dehydratase [Fusobacterium mortiferum]
MKKGIILILMLVLCSLGYAKDKVEEIAKKGVLRVGTTADYKPFTYKSGEEYKGYDIEVAKLLAKELGVELEIVPTTWKTLLEDLKADKYDIAMGGITRTIKRQIEAEMSNPYLVFGKCYLVRKGDKAKYNSIEAVNNPKVRVGVNIGGTNEVFADTYLPKANIIRYKNNLDVPVAVENNEVDVMITETPEAITYEKNNPKLEGALVDTPLTKSQMGYVVKKDEIHLLNTVNFILNELEVRGDIERLKAEYLK